MDINEEKIKNIADDLISEIIDTDPVKLKLYKKAMKKALPLHYRQWLAAYYFMVQVEKKGGAKGGNSSPSLPSDEVQLFISIGKGRKVSFKNLIDLLVRTGKVEKRAIGRIRILDNYSFVCVKKSEADKVINTLNGIDYRGKKLSVEPARSQGS